MSKSAALGKNLFNSKCASCHAIFKDATGPGILAVCGGLYSRLGAALSPRCVLPSSALVHPRNRYCFSRCNGSLDEHRLSTPAPDVRGFRQLGPPQVL